MFIMPMMKVRERDERDRMIRERDAQRNYSQQQQQRNIYEQQQQQYVNAHRNMYEKQPYGYGSLPTHYHHHNQPMPQFVAPPSRYSSGKYHYEGVRYPPPLYEGYPPSHLVAQGGYYGSPSNYQYNVAGYTAVAQVAPHHHAPPGYNVPTTTVYNGSYQDKEVPLSTVPSTEDRSKDGSLHAVSSSFSNEGVVGSSKALMKSMQSPGVVTSNGSGSVVGKLYLCCLCTSCVHFYTLSFRLIPFLVYFHLTISSTQNQQKREEYQINHHSNQVNPTKMTLHHGIKRRMRCSDLQ